MMLCLNLHHNELKRKNAVDSLGYWIEWIYYGKSTVMNAFMQHVRNTIISGIVFLIPVFVIIVILQNLYSKLTGFGKQLSALLGIKSVAGVGAATIGTTILLILIFYCCGLLVRFAMFSSLRNWIDRGLMFIPGYVNYKVKMEEKLMPKVESRVAALIRTGDVERPGFLVNRRENKCTVFIPNSPDTDTGEVWIVDEIQVKELGIADAVFLNGIRHSGKNLKV
jgi:uncharacterized membrane protein